MIKEMSNAQARLSTREADNIRLEGLIDRVSEDKKRLTQRVNKLTANGKDFTLRILKL